MCKASLSGGFGGVLRKKWYNERNGNGLSVPLFTFPSYRFAALLSSFAFLLN